MSRVIPIIENYKHDPKYILGHSKMTDRGLVVTMLDGKEITKEQMFNIFGGAAVFVDQMVRKDNVDLIKVFTITAFST